MKNVSLDGKSNGFEESSILGNSTNLKINLQQVKGNYMPSSDDTQLKHYFGCKLCPHRGTDRCLDIQRSGYEKGDNLPVHRIEKGEVHANRICSGRINEVKAFFKLMDKPSGIRLIMNKNQQQLQDVMEQLYGRLLDVKQEKGALSEDETNLLAAYAKLARDVGEQLGKRLKQDEGIKLSSELLTPSQINRLIEGSEKVVEAQLISKEISQEEERGE